MKIAIVTDYFEPSLSGITEHVRGQARHLLALGHEVTVVTGNVAHRLATADAPVRPPATAYEVIRMGTAVALYGNGGQTLHTVGYRLGRRLAALFRARQFDVVHVHAPHNPRMPAWAIDRVPSGSLAVGTFHTVFPITRSRRLQAQLLRPTIQRLDGRICVSAACIGSLRPLYPFSYDVIPNGVDTEVFTPSAEPARPARAGVRTIAFLGRFDPRNQLGLMLDAFRVICDETDDVRLIVIGDGPLRAHYVRRMSARARARTVFAGRLDHTRPQHLTSADIACFTCRRSSFGMALLEAMSCGLPVVAVETDGSSMLIEEGVSGRLVPGPGTADGLAAAVRYLLDRPAHRAALGRTARRVVVERFAWSSVAQSLETYYRSLRSGTRVPAASVSH